jgi:hypothetical protein
MGKRLMDYDPLTETSTWHEYDESEDRTIITREQNVEDILTSNKAAQNGYDRHLARQSEMRRVASIPNSIMEKWLTEDGVDVFNPDHWPAVKRKLNSSEYLYLRTAPTVV